MNKRIALDYNNSIIIEVLYTSKNNFEKFIINLINSTKTIIGYFF
jgi:hypothetical protein